MTAVKSTTSNPNTKKMATKSSEEIKSDFPLSEKDEVKKAERKLQQSQKKGS
jgi:hypothetical protein